MNNLYLLALPAFTISLLLSGCEEKVELQADVYDTATVAYRSINITVEAAGIIEPETTIEVKSKASGEILALNAETGDHIEEGTLLVQVDKRSPRNNFSQSEADLEAARARRQIALTQLNRTRSLIERGVVTETEYETAQLELANAEALVISRQVGLENTRIALDDTDVRAPISGIIIEKNVERGQVISSPTQDVGGGTILLKMADLSTVQVRTLVDETDIGKIQPGMPVTVNVAAFPNQPFTGQVLKIEPLATVEQNITMFPVLIRLDNPAGLLRPGMNAEVRINIAQADNILAIPTIALRTSRDIATTATMLGLAETELQELITASQRKQFPEVDSISRDDTTTSVNAGNRTRQTRTGNSNQPSTDYQYGGDYWVLRIINETPEPIAVRSGITDLDYSEIVSGLQENDQVLVFPSSGLIERQARMQESLNRFMRLPGTGSRN
jgi:HlyD family secretion protein